MGRGIAAALNDICEDEGLDTALRVAERWHRALEQMAEVATEEQLHAITMLNRSVEMAIALLRGEA
jgi:hypothetical protein